MVRVFQHATADIMLMAQVANKIPQRTADLMGMYVMHLYVQMELRLVVLQALVWLQHAVMAIVVMVRVV